MGKFYGMVCGNRGVATRMGSKESGITSSAQSWEGSVVVRLFYDYDGNLVVRLGAPENSDSMMPIRYWEGSFDELRYELGLGGIKPRIKKYAAESGLNHNDLMKAYEAGVPLDDIMA